MTEWELKKKRRKARIDGICIDCFENEATVNKEGHSSVRCDECRCKVRQGERPEPKPTTAKPRMVSDGDVSTGCFFDTPEFIEYTLKVARAAKCIDGLITVGVVKKNLGDDLLDGDPLVKALEDLEVTGEIEKVQDSGYTKWRYVGNVRAPQPVHGFNGEKKALPWTDNNIIFGAKCA